MPFNINLKEIYTFEKRENEGLIYFKEFDFFRFKLIYERYIYFRYR
jgi:hypothetical protein